MKKETFIFHKKHATVDQEDTTLLHPPHVSLAVQDMLGISK